MSDKKIAVGEFVAKSERIRDARGIECMYVLCPVMVPDKIDTDKDWITKSDLEMSAFDFSMRYSGVYKEQVDKKIPIKEDGVTGIGHKEMVHKSDVAVVENYCLPFSGKIGNVELPQGTWMQGLLVYSEEVMKQIESGDLNGLSVGGSSDLVEEVPPGHLFSS